MKSSLTRRPVHAAVLGGLALTALGAALLVPSVLADDDPPGEVGGDRPPVTADPAPATPVTGDPPPAPAAPDRPTTDPTTSPVGGSPTAPGTDLADGRHLGRLTAAYVAPDELVVDVLQLFTGDAARAAAAEDGVPADAVHDFYLRNVNDRLRSLPVSQAVVTRVDCGGDGCVEGAPGDYGALTRFLEEDTSRLWWLTVEGGAVVAIDEMYLP